MALSQAAGAGSEVDEETKVMIRQTAEWFHANPEKSKVRCALSRSIAPTEGVCALLFAFGVVPWCLMLMHVSACALVLNS